MSLLVADRADTRRVQYVITFVRSERVNDYFRMLTLEALTAIAHETVFPEIGARAVIAGFRRAVVNDESAIGVPVPLVAFALVTGDTIDAYFTVGAYHVDAIVHVDVAHFPFETWRALADEFATRTRQ